MSSTAPAIKKEQCDESTQPDRLRSLRSFGTALQRFQYQEQALAPSRDNDKQDVKRLTSPRKRTLPQTLSSSTISPSPTKKRAPSSAYAHPSRYAHLPKLQDVLAPNLICVFVGTNPGIKTATAGHAYAHPSNLFWKLLHSSGCTNRRCRPEEDVDLPRLYGMGNTNIVERPSRNAAELSKREMADGTPILEAKIRHFRPEAVCIVGKGIWEAIWRYRYGRNITKDDFRYGWQDEIQNMGVAGEDDPQGAWDGARVFVTTSTSGLSAGMRPHEKEAIWAPFGQWVKDRRAERSESCVDPGSRNVKHEP